MSYSGLEALGRGSLAATEAGKVDVRPSRAPHGSGRLPTAVAAGKRMKSREDTVAGCDALAVSDLARAVLADTANGRRKFEQSAASWQQRAGLLQGMADGIARRSARGEAKRDRANPTGDAL
jgi:hypothetical protein